jgi:hypothetical protein
MLKGVTPDKNLKCPACGSRHILVFFEVSNEPAALAARAHIDLDEYSGDAKSGNFALRTPPAS